MVFWARHDPLFDGRKSIPVNYLPGTIDLIALNQYRLMKT
jgi:hypothetical protein